MADKKTSPYSRRLHEIIHPMDPEAFEWLVQNVVEVVVSSLVREGFIIQDEAMSVIFGPPNMGAGKSEWTKEGYLRHVVATLQLFAEGDMDSDENKRNQTMNGSKTLTQAIAFLTEVESRGEIDDFRNKVKSGFLRDAATSHLRRLFNIGENAASTAIDLF